MTHATMQYEWTLGLPAGWRVVLRCREIPVIDGMIVGRDMKEAAQSLKAFNQRREELGLTAIVA
jgi:hypothetical protein